MNENRVKELRHVRAGDLKADDCNWRRHPQAQRDALEVILKRVGYADAVIARETPDGLVIIDGHLRAELDAEQVVPVLVTDLSEAEAGELLLTLDPLAAMAEADTQALAELANSMPDDEDFRELLTGLHDADLFPPPTPDVDPDDAPEPPEEPVTQRGDVWTLGRHRLMCGDSKEDFGKLGDASGGFVLTDPPYGIGIVKVQTVGMPGPSPTFAKRGRVSGVAGVVEPRQYIPFANDDRPFDPTWLLSVGKAQIIFGVQHFASKLRDGTAWICWDKGVEHPSFSAFELAWTSVQGHTRMYRHRWSGMVRHGSRDVELADRIHPTQKPVGLLEEILEDMGKGYDLILDPYLGSGSTLIAAERQGRACWAMEIEPRYVDVSVKRWEDYTGQKATREEVTQLPSPGAL